MYLKVLPLLIVNCSYPISKDAVNLNCTFQVALVGLSHGAHLRHSDLCKNPGINPDPEDCRKFAVCVITPENTLKLVAQPTCPLGYAYANTTCFPANQVTDCPSAYEPNLELENAVKSRVADADCASVGPGAGCVDSSLVICYLKDGEHRVAFELQCGSGSDPRAAQCCVEDGYPHCC